MQLLMAGDRHAAMGRRIIDGIGATEMIHIFISAAARRSGRVLLASRCQGIEPAYWTIGANATESNMN
jgi:hypothetical protein